MPIVARRFVNQKRIATAVRKAERLLRPDVKRIMFSIEPDWTEEESLFFRIILSDPASAPARLYKTTRRIELTIQNEIKADELGLQTYFNFRSESEQAEMRDPAWDL